MFESLKFRLLDFDIMSISNSLITNSFSQSFSTCAISLLAVAVASVLPSLAAAQVTVGGLMDIGVSRIDNGSVSKTAVTTGDRSSNNLRFSGVEKISPDLNAFFHAELGFDVDNGNLNGAAPANQTTYGTAPASGFGFTRRSVVGINGSWGEIRGGRDYTPIFSASAATSVISTSGWGSYLAYANGAATASTRGTAGDGTGILGHDIRFSNAVFYSSPSISGFRLNLAATQGYGYDDFTSSKGSGWSFAATYTNKGFYGHISGLAKKEVNGADVTASALGISYQFGDFKVGWGGQAVKRDAYLTVAAAESASGWLGLSYQMGPTRFAAQWATADNKADGKIGTMGGGDGAYDAKSLTLMVNHDLSKRTSLYGTWGKVTNGAMQSMGIRTNGASFAASGNGADPSAFGVGLVHSF